MGVLDKIASLSNPEYTAKFQRLCGISYYSDNRVINPTIKDVSANKESDTELHKRKGFQECVPLINNNNVGTVHGDLERTSVRTPRPEIDRIWPHLTVFQKVLFYVLTFASSLGNEVFFLLFFPYVAWNIDSVVFRQAGVVWCLSMYTGQATKDYLMWPRPTSPPVVRLETNFETEFAMPSTHAISATSIPFMLAYTIISRYEISPILAVSVAICWCLLVCLSRLYLGVHSVLDLASGVIATFVIMLLTVPYVKEFDMFQQSNPIAPLVVLVFTVALCTVCYPNLAEVSNTTKGDAVQIVSVAAGVTLGTLINYQYGFTVDKGQLFQAQIVFPTLTMIGESILRMVIGVVILAALHSLVKYPSIKFFSYIFNLDKPNKKHPSVETAYKFVTTYMVGFGLICLVPYIHFLLGLGRSAYFNEVQ